MSDFHSAMCPDDLDQRHRGDLWPVADEGAQDEALSEAADTAVTAYLGGRQPVLEPIEALLPARKDESQ